ncbi:MAG: PQQ-binding-like beta-propeller repeat protein [Planctomycetota bacterium]
MTNDELHALIQEKAPADLTPEECRLLREAVRTAPELLREIADRIKIDEYLAHALGRPQVSVEQVLARVAARRARAIGVRTKYGLVVCAVVAGLLSGLFLLGRGRDWRFGAVAQKPAATQPPASEPAAPPAEAKPAETVAAPATPAAPAAVAEIPPAPPAAPTPAPAAAAPPPAVNLPVVGLFKNPPAESATPDDKSLARWLAAYEAAPPKFSTQPIEGKPCGRFEGLARLQGGLPPGAAVRLASPDYANLRIHVWSGAKGVSLDAHGPTGPWTAYATSRADDKPIPKAYVTVARDDGRMARTNPAGTVGIELRYEDGLVVLARGDVRIMEAPLDAPPTEIVFEGAATFRDIAAVQALPLPAVREPEKRPAADLLAAATDAWVRGGDSSVGFTVHDDDTATLTAVDNKQPAWAVLPLAAGSLREIVVRLEGIVPGVGLVVGDGKAAPQSVLMFVANKNAPGVGQLARMSPGDNTLESAEPLAARSFTFVEGTTWVRLRQCGGVQRFDVSPDGHSWVMGSEPQPAFGSVGIYAVAHPSARSITVTKLAESRLSALESLAPADLRDTAVDLPPQGPLATWLAAADAAKPPAADTGAWRRACAVVALVRYAPKDLALDLLGFLWQESLQMEMPTAARWALLDEIVSLAPVVDEPAAAGRITALFDQWGARLARAGEPRPYSAIAFEQMTAPLRCGQPFLAFSEPLARRELLTLLAAGDDEAIRALRERLAFFGFLSKPANEAFFQWAGAAAASRGTGKPTPLAAEWRHPLVLTPGKESQSVHAELSGAVAGEDWQDACRLIDAAAADGLIDVLPDLEDADLVVSLPVAVATVMRDNPGLLAAMRQDREQIGGLRVLAAIDAGDAAAVEAATVQFHGTVAAADARAWLGDRSMAAGRFAAALRHYEAAPLTVPADDAKKTTRTAAAIELAGKLTAVQTPPAAGVVSLPKAPTLTATLKARLEGDVGVNPAALPPPLAQGGVGWPPHAIDWAARQLAVLPLADRLLVSNRFQLASHDPLTGVVQWRAGLGGDAGATHDWPGQPMRPVATATHAFVRRLRKAGPAVASIKLADGSIAWEQAAAADRWYVSDPLLAGAGELVVCTARKVEEDYALAVATLDAATGRLIRETPLAKLSPAWWAVRDCQFADVGGLRVVLAGGSVIACDDEGRLAWARRDTWLPPPVDGFWMLEASAPPVALGGLLGGLLYVVQPGVPGLVALDTASGRVAWRLSDASVSRILGIAKGRLFVQRVGPMVAGMSPAVAADVIALDAATGKPTWRFGPADLLDASLASDSGLLVALREPVAAKNTRLAVVVRLDPETGAEMNRWPLAGCEDPQPCLGPIVPAAGKLWTFFGRGPADATRDLMTLE